MEKIVRTIREGGTGSVSEDDRQPDFLPDKYEPGSHNAIGIIGLSEGIKYIAERTVEKLAEHDLDLVCTFLEGISNVDGITFFGPQGVRNRIGVFSVRIEGYEPQELSAILESQFGILTRSGIHCAPLAHAAIGTLETGGATRFSFGPFVSKQDVNYATDALAEIAMSRVGARL
jgi:selenocysteine lyase/cysteine desulfurase